MKLINSDAKKWRNALAVARVPLFAEERRLIIAGIIGR